MNIGIKGWTHCIAKVRMMIRESDGRHGRSSNVSVLKPSNLAASSTGRGRKALGDHILLGLRVQRGVKQLIRQVRLQAQDSLRFGDQALLGHVNRNLQRSWSRALSVARLQHVELTLLDCELDVLHILTNRQHSKPWIMPALGIRRGPVLEGASL